MIGFDSPLLLVGLVAVGIPLVVHLYFKPRGRTLYFSTLRFLKTSYRKRLRSIQLRNLLVLITRACLLGLLVTAFAEPYSRSKGAALLSPQSKTSSVIVLDNSYSMRYWEGNRSRFQAARERTRQLLERMDVEEESALVLAGGKRRLPIRRLTTDRARITEELEAAEISMTAADLGWAVRAAFSLLDTSARPNRVVYLVTDAQDRAFQDWHAPVAEMKGADRTVVCLVNVSEDRSSDNVGIMAVKLPAGASAASGSMPVGVLVKNFSDQKKELVVELEIAGKVRGSKPATFEPGEERSVQLEVPVSRSGAYLGQVRLSTDRLTTDNAWHFGLTIDTTVPVLCVNGEPSNVPKEDELLFLLAALSPPGGQSPFQVKQVTPAEAESWDLVRYHLVILANVRAVEGRFLEQLGRYVNRGGALLVFLGDRVDRESYGRYLCAGGGGELLPARLGELVSSAVGQPFGWFDSGHPLFHRFAKGRPFTEFSASRYYRLAQMGSADRVLARFGVNDPLLVERAVGRGKVVLCTTSADREWSNFPAHPNYVALVHEICGYLTRQGQTRFPAYRVGDSVSFDPTTSFARERYYVRGPDGEETPLNRYERGRKAAYLFRRIEQPGVYEVRQCLEDGRELTSHFVANVDPRESKLEYTPAEKIRKQLQPASVCFSEEELFGHEDDIVKAVLAHSLWWVLLIVVLFMLAAEGFFATKASLGDTARES